MNTYRNYMGSAILIEAVRQEVVTETKADIVIDTAVYERSSHYLSLELNIPPAKVTKIYKTAINNLKKWLCSGNLEAELLLLRYRWL